MKEYQFRHALRETGEPIDGCFACLANNLEEATRIHDRFLQTHAPHLVTYGAATIATPYGVLADMAVELDRHSTMPRASVCDYRPAYGGWDLH